MFGKQQLRVVDSASRFQDFFYELQKDRIDYCFRWSFNDEKRRTIYIQICREAYPFRVAIPFIGDDHTVDSRPMVASRQSLFHVAAFAARLAVGKDFFDESDRPMGHECTIKRQG